MTQKLSKKNNMTLFSHENLPGVIHDFQSAFLSENTSSFASFYSCMNHAVHTTTFDVDRVGQSNFLLFHPKKLIYPYWDLLYLFVAYWAKRLLDKNRFNHIYLNLYHWTKVKPQPKLRIHHYCSIVITTQWV